MEGARHTFELTVQSTETRPSENTQRSVLAAMSQKFGAGVEIATADLDAPRRDPVIGTVQVEDAERLVNVYAYLKPHDLVRVGEMTARGDERIETRKLHEVDGDDADGRVLGEAQGDVLVLTEREDSP